MILRQLKPERYEQLCRQLAEYAHKEPFSASCTVLLQINGEEYQLKVQPESRRRIAALQAVRLCRGQEGSCYELIVDGSMLSALLEILVKQGIHQK